MIAKEAVQAKLKTHTQYKTSAGVKVPGVTSILRVLDKPALLGWAWRCGNDGIEMNSYRDDLAGVGRLVHAMILKHYDPEKVFDESEYTPQDHDRAANSFLSFLEWEKRREVKPILLETPLVYEDEKGLAYGGTPDFYGEANGRPTLIDFKSGSGIYEEAYYQVAAYAELLRRGHPLEGDLVSESGYNFSPEQAIILNIPRAENENFTEIVINRPMTEELAIFHHCLGIYNLKKRIKKL